MTNKLLLSSIFLALMISCKAKEPYPVEVMTNLVQACTVSAVQQGASQDHAQSRCTCIADKVQANIKLEDYLALELRIASGDKKALAEFSPHIAQCLSSESTRSETIKVPWANETVINFTQSCVKNAENGGASTAKAKGYCSCMVDALQRDFSQSEFISLEMRLMTGDATAAKKFAPFIQRCTR